MRLPLLLAASCVFAVPAFAGHEPSHSDAAQPAAAQPVAAEHPAEEVYKIGIQQSPVNITQFMKGDLADIKFDYKDIPLDVVNTGHTIQANAAPGSMATFDGAAYQLAQIHFHTPSEHYMDGSPYPMEAHFVHKNDKGDLAVIGVMMKVGGANQTIQKMWDNIGKKPEGLTVSPYDLLPAKPEYFRYDGSLTTPPYTEGVQWHVMQQPIEISEAQLLAYQTLFPHNARVLQPLNGRVLKGD